MYAGEHCTTTSGVWLQTVLISSGKLFSHSDIPLLTKIEKLLMVARVPHIYNMVYVTVNLNHIIIPELIIHPPRQIYHISCTIHHVKVSEYEYGQVTHTVQ